MSNGRKKGEKKLSQGSPKCPECVRVKKVKCAALTQLSQFWDVGREKLIIKI